MSWNIEYVKTKSNPLTFLNYQNLKAGSKTTDSVPTIFYGRKIVDEQRNKPVPTEKKLSLISRDESLSLAHFGIFRPSRF